MQSFFLLTFDSTHDALAAQSALKYLKPRIIPVPRVISAGCGMALHFEAEDEQHARTISFDLRSKDVQSSLYAIEDTPPRYRKLGE